MTTSKMSKFLQDNLGISSDELRTMPSTRIREIVANSQNRSVEVIGNNDRYIFIADIDKDKKPSRNPL